MARPGEIIEAPARGERLRWLQTGFETAGTLLQFEFWANPGCGYMPPHVHLNQEERSLVLAGTATYEIAGERRIARAGEQVVVPPGVRHVNPWNRGDEHLHLRVDAWPALGVELFFETWFGLVRDRRTRHLNRRWLLGYRQASLTVGTIASQTYDARLPVALQRLGMPLLAVLGRLVCFEPFYREYSGLDRSYPDMLRSRRC
jgi:mannose-6-phosphate isomerase-like protein (cupin superfamily)